MARRKIEKRHIRNIQKVRSTYYISVPIDLMRKLRWQERQKVEVKGYGKGKILIEDWKR